MVQNLALDLSGRYEEYGVTDNLCETNLNLIPAHEAPPGAIDTCLREMARRDLFLANASVSMPITDAWVALIGDEVAGLAWSLTRHHGTSIDVRVLPRFRRGGIGASLFDAVADSQVYPLFASCDAAQSSAVKFLEKRQFHLDGAVYAQRWDGSAEDVPPAFKTAQLEDTQDHVLVEEILANAYGRHWLQPSLDFIPPAERLTHVAVKDGRAVGALVARCSNRAIVVCGLGVLPTARRGGVGRMLLCHAMNEGATRNLGVAARVAADDEHTIAWTRALGFWTYRTRVHFSIGRTDEALTSP